MDIAIKKAVRHSVNLIMSISGVSGSGKTYSALLVAAGLAGPNGRVGFIDTENGRGCMYADSPGIVAALSNGYETAEMTAPFSPARYMEFIDAFERAGVKVLVIDSASHEWEGVGSCSEMAEADKGRWNRAKKEHKRFVMRLLNSSMHIIICLRAREKSKIIDKRDSPDGKEHVIPLGIQPVAEKSFVFEMMCSWLVREGTHLAEPIKLPEQFQKLFPEARLLTKADGDAIRLWNEGAPAMDAMEKLTRQSRAAALEGMVSYQTFFKNLAKPQQATLSTSPAHAENKQIAAQADADAIEARAEELSAHPRFRALLGAIGHESWPDVPAGKRADVLSEIERELAS